MVLAALFAVPAQAFSGMSSWYGGPCDPGDNNITASGISNTVPGFATRWVPFGKWFVVTGPNGRRALGVSLERGPAAWTGRTVDLNFTLARRLGYPAPGGCVQGYPNGWVSALEVPAFHYPSCSAVARRAGFWLRKRVRTLGRPGNCLRGSAVRAMRRYQLVHHRPFAARRGEVDQGTWKLLYAAG